MFKIPRAYYDEMIAHAKEAAPDECCGILAGEGGRVIHVYRTTNSEHSPYRYNVEPKELLRILNDLDDKGWTMAGIYHSHIATAAYPSPTDVRLAANWPDPLYVLVSLQDADHSDLRAFQIHEGEVMEAPIRIVED